MLIHSIVRPLLLAGMTVISVVGVTAAQELAQDPIQVVAPGKPITLRDAIARVMDTNPRLAGQKFALAASDARRDQAALRPAFQVGLEAEDIFGTDRLSKFDDATITLQLSTVLELGGKRGNRIGAAERERGLLLTELDAEKLDIIAEVTRRFIRVVAVQREVTLAKRSLELATNTRKAVALRVSTGRGAAVEERNAEIALTRAEIEKSRAETGVLQAWQSLSAMWGGDAGGSMAVAAELFTLPDLGAMAALDAMLLQNPNLARFASERRVEEAKLRLAESQATPDLSVGAGVRRLEADRSNAFVLSFSMPLGTGSRSAPYAAEARSKLQQLDFREQAARAELKATLSALYQEASQRGSELALLREKAVPQAESASDLTQSGFSAGRFSLLELLTAQQQLIELQRSAIDAAVAYHNALIEIERLTARSASAGVGN
ncbi:MAG: TolC family protein [Rhodospirillaceae bacterium]|nr:TolC family protein [Rhodospirillaceae bacterium]